MVPIIGFLSTTLPFKKKQTQNSTNALSVIFIHEGINANNYSFVFYCEFVMLVI